MTLSMWDLAARHFEPQTQTRPTWATPGDLAKHINPRTVQTPALDLIDDALVRAFNTPDSRLIICMPPQEGKSTRGTGDFPVWVLTQRPETRIVTASYAQSLANRNGRVIRRRITDNPDLGLAIAPDNGSIQEWELDKTGQRGGVLSVGVGAGVTGRACDLMIIDDPIKDRAQADSDVYRENVWDWWTDAASSRLAPGAPVILILTRWHHDDLAGRLLERDAEAGWEVLNIPAQADYDPSKGETDVLGRAPGEYMLSARGRTQAQWEQRKATAGSRSWEALYQGNPTPGTGDILKSSWWQTWDAAPYLERDDGARIIPDLTDVELVQSWDMTFKGTSTSDFVVGQVWMRRGNRVWLLDQVRGRWSFTETVRQVRALTARWPQAIRKLVEDKANGPAVITSLQSQLGGFVPVEPEGSKSSRAEAISPVVEAGQVLLPPVETHPWVGEFVDEAASFPAGKHDDQVDAATQAIHRLLIVPLLAGMTLEATDVLGDEHALDLDWADDTY